MKLILVSGTKSSTKCHIQCWTLGDRSLLMSPRSSCQVGERQKKALSEHLNYSYHSEHIILKAHTWVCAMSCPQLGTILYHPGCQLEISKSWLIVIKTTQVFINWFIKKADNWQFQVWFCYSVISLIFSWFKKDSVYQTPHARTSVLRQGQRVL